MPPLPVRVLQQIDLSITKGMAEAFRDTEFKFFFMLRVAEEAHDCNGELIDPVCF